MAANAACARQKTAMAHEVGNIQGITEKKISESRSYLLNRVGQGAYANGLGESPRWVRYSTAPIEDREYLDPTTSGNVSDSMSARGDNGSATDYNTDINSQDGLCDIPGTTIHHGFDEFGRILNVKAFETDPFCAFTLIHQGKEHLDAVRRMIREDLPMRGREQFEYAIERLVLENASYNMSAIAGFKYSAGVFPEIPTSGLTLGMVRRIMPVLRNQGWEGPMEVTTSQSAFEKMRSEYKTTMGVELQGTLESSETHLLGDDVNVVNWAGIRWIIQDLPLRGYLVGTAGGGYKLVPVYPSKTRVGTGAGVVSDSNEDYFNCRTTVDGQSHELFEVGFYVHPSAAQRQAFGLPQMLDKSFANNQFNMEVKLIDGSYIDCNEDNFKWKYRMLHAFGFLAHNPERMGAIIYKVSPEEITTYTPVCVDETPSDPADAVVGPEAEVNPHNDCSLEAAENDCSGETEADFVPTPSESDPSPANTPGELSVFNTAVEVVAGEDGTVTLSVERKVGSEDSITVDVTIADGTATDGQDFDDPTPNPQTLVWAAGETGKKTLDVGILAAATVGQNFTATLSNPVNLDNGGSPPTLVTGATVATVTFIA